MTSIESPDAPDRGRVQDLIERARSAELQARRGVARRLYEAALYQLRATPEPALAGDLVRWVARTYMDGANPEAALDCLEAARATAEAVGDRAGEARAANCEGIVHFQTGQLDEAEQRYGWALGRAVDAGDPQLVAMIQQNMGNVANVRGDSDRALLHYTSALESYRAEALDEYVGPLLNNMGRVHIDLGRWADAEALLDEAHAICEQAGDVDNQILAYVNRTRLWIARGDRASARMACDTAEDLSRQTGDRRWLGEILMHSGVLHRHAGESDLAEERLLGAAERARIEQDVLLEAEAVREVAEVYRRDGRNQETLHALNTAHRLFSELRARRELADISRRLESLEAAFLEIVREWGESIESKDRYTQGHCVRVADLACALAERAGIDPSALIWFRMGAVLHDLGKVVVPSEILNKEGPPSEAEWAILRQHPQAGVDLLGDVEFPWDVRPMILHHHERWDGTGYPHHLAGEDIPLAARVLCVADVFDALTTDRSYRPGHSMAAALEIMAREVGHVLDPRLFRLFVEILEEREARRDGEGEPPEARAGSSRSAA